MFHFNLTLAMKFNNILTFGTLAICASAMTSCGSDWLEIPNNTQRPVEEYYTTDAAIQESIVAAYDPMCWFDYGNNYCGLNIMPDTWADELFVGGQDANDMKQWKHAWNFTHTPSTVGDLTIYSNLYSGVKRCNDAIKYMDEYWTSGKTEEKYAYYRDQVVTLRAFYYNWLWHLWGNIVYYDKNPDDFYAPQYSADEVYGFIVADLENVIASNTLKWKSDVADYGRMTMAFAYMLYTEVVMYQNDTARFPKALEYMKQIINSPEYSLVNDYASIWKVENEWCKESIYEINYSDYQGQRNWSWGGTSGGSVVPAMILPRNYDKSDGIHDGGGWGFGCVRRSVYNAYDEKDTRRDASIWAPAEGSYQVGYQDTGLFLAKYAGLIGGNAGQTADATLNYNNNYRLYRYSEALLNAAELVVRGAGSGDAQGWLDQVRSRAGVGSVPATLENILQERKYEFLGEGKRFWDIIRSGLGETLLVPDNELANPNENRTGRYTPNKKYLPFPQSEIDQANGGITQNPYND